MKTVRVYQLHPSPTLFQRLKTAQMEAARVWNTPWPGQHEMQQATKNRFALHSQSVQAVSKEQGRVVLPMGKGRKSLVLPLYLAEEAGACTLVWNRGFELHVCADGPVCQKAIPLHEGLASLEETATRQADGLPEV